MVIHRSPTGPVALAIDIGSSSVRALIYDQNGTQMPESEARRSYRPHSTDDGGSESNADELVRLVVECVDEVVSEVGTAGVEIAAVGITSFWHGLLGLGVDDRPVTPVYMWSDRRSGDDAKALVVSLSAQDVHARTGCRLHSSYWPAKIHWWRRTQAQKHPAVAQWVSITDYLSLILCGGRETSVSMASGTGLLNRQTLQWDAVLLAVSGIDLSYLPSIVDRDEALPSLLPEFARRWPSLVGVPWFPAIGDGAAANVGAGCVTPDAVAMTIGTSAAMRIIAPTVGTVAGTAIPERLWCYRLDRKHEVIGGALSNGGNVTAWLAKSLFGQGFDVLTRDASQVEPDGHGLTVLPLLAGERSPSWREHATATFHGCTLATTPADLFRAALEATAYRLGAIYDDLRSVAASEHEIRANGAAALGSPLWLQVIGDTLAHDIVAVDMEAEASARGAALCALEAAGLRDGLAGPRDPTATVYCASNSNHEVYRRARERQDRLECALTGFFEVSR